MLKHCGCSKEDSNAFLPNGLSWHKNAVGNKTKGWGEELGLPSHLYNAIDVAVPGSEVFIGTPHGSQNFQEC